MKRRTVIGLHPQSQERRAWLDRQKIDPITAALMERLRSQDKELFSNKLLAALRHQFGGHE